MEPPWPHPRRWAREVLCPIYWRTAVAHCGAAQAREALLAMARGSWGPGWAWAQVALAQRMVFQALIDPGWGDDVDSPPSTPRDQ